MAKTLVYSLVLRVPRSQPEEDVSREVEGVLSAAGWRCKLSPRATVTLEDGQKAKRPDPPQTGQPHPLGFKRVHQAPAGAGPKAAAVAREPVQGDGLDELRERAREALAHGARVTFVDPALLLDLLRSWS